MVFQLKVVSPLTCVLFTWFTGKGGKNFKKGKKRDEGENRRDLIFKEDGQGVL